jgi:uncharacterized protein (TIGR00251 family)
VSRGPLAAAADGVRLALRVSPGAGRDAIAGLIEMPPGETRLKVSVTAPPEGGKANDAVIRLLAKSWKLPRTSLTVVAGATDRNKLIHIQGDAPALMQRLLPLLPEEATP